MRQAMRYLMLALALVLVGAMNAPAQTAPTTATAPALNLPEQVSPTLLRPLGDREDRLNGNTLATKNRLNGNAQLRAVASDLKSAGEAMATATVELYKGKQAASVKPQDDALAALDAAIQKLEAEKKKIDDQLNEKDIAAFRREYEAIKAQQEDVKKEADAIAKRKEMRGELLDMDLKRLAAESTRQGGLSGKVSALSKDDKLSKYEVIVWINGQITESMDDAKTRLGKAEVGVRVASAQQTAIDRLDDIINALKEEQARKKDNFERPSGGGGGGGGGKPPLIPPVAQLKLLKSQQVIVNAGTTKTQKDLDAATDEAARSQLKDQAVKLGEKQDKIKDIAKKIVDGLKGP